MWRFVKRGWRIVTEVHTISWVLLEIFGITVPPTGFYLWASEQGIFSGPIVSAIAVVGLCLIILTWLAVVGKTSHKEEPPMVNRTFDVVSFRSNDGAVLPNSTNDTNVLKNAPKVFTEYTAKPIDQ